jgi:hypothetical protein
MYISLCDRKDAWNIMKHAVQSSARMVQPGLAVALLRTKLLQFGEKVRSLVPTGSILKFHRTMMLCKELPILLNISHRFWAGTGLTFSMVLRYRTIWAAKLNHYCRVLLLIIVFAVHRRTLFYLAVFYCLCKYSYILFICSNKLVGLELEPTFYMKEFAKFSVCAIVWIAHCRNPPYISIYVPIQFAAC